MLFIILFIFICFIDFYFIIFLKCLFIYLLNLKIICFYRKLTKGTTNGEMNRKFGFFGKHGRFTRLQIWYLERNDGESFGGGLNMLFWVVQVVFFRKV